MASFQDLYDEAMYDASMGEADAAIEKLKSILEQDPNHFEAQLALGGVYFTKGDYQAAVSEGHKAEKMRPNEQMVHTNLSRAYVKLGDKKTAEHHGLQARIASWRENMAPPTPGQTKSELDMAPPPTAPPKMATPEKFPDMPWKKNKVVNNPDSQ